MGNLNKVLLIGRLGQKPERKVTNAGKSVCSFSIATSENYSDRDGQRQERTEWHRVVAWEKLAELTERYLDKGSQVYIEGRLQTREWTDKDNVKHYTTEIIAQQLQFLDPARGGQGAPGRSDNSQSFGQPRNHYQDKQGNPPSFGGQPAQGQPAQGQQQISNDFIEDDVPF